MRFAVQPSAWQRPSVVLLLLAALYLSGCSRQQGDALVVYSAGPRPLIEQVVTAYEEKHGQRVELYAATTGQVMARLEAEKYRPRADVVVLASQLGAEALKSQQRLHRYEPKDVAGTRTQWHDPDGYYHATAGAVVAMAMHANAPAPPDWSTALAGDWPGSLTMPSPSRSGSAADFLIAFNLHRGESVWQEWRRARAVAGLDFAAANSQAITGLVLHAYDGMLAAADYLIYRQIAGGASLRVHYPADGSVLVTRPIAILEGSPRLEAARDFTDHYFSTAMQEAVAAQFLLPARHDVDAHEIRGNALPEPLIETDMQQALAKQIPILRRFQLEIERAQVIRE